MTPRFRDLGDAGSTLGRALSGAVPGDGVLVAVVPNGVPVALAAAGVSGHDVRPLWVDRGPDGVRVREFGNVTDVVHVVVDDGVESGSVARAVAPPLRRAGAREVWLAVPWCPSVLLSELDELFDRVIVLHEAKPNESLASCFEIFDTIDVQTAERLLL